MGSQFATFQQYIYTQDDVRTALHQAGIVSGKTVILHASLFDLGHMLDDQGDLPQTWLNLLLEAVGPQGAVILPAFTYSYCKHKVYDPHKSLSTVNLLANHAIVTHQGYRTLDPIFSYVILPNSEAIAHKIANYQFSNICFASEHSILGLAYTLCDQPIIAEIKSKQRGADVLTVMHFVDQEINRPTRFMKKFTGTTRINGVEQPTECHYFCRVFAPNTAIDDTKILPIAEHTVPLGAGSIEFYDLKAYLQDYKEKTLADPWLWLKGPALSTEQLQALRAKEQIEELDSIKPVFLQPVKL